MNAVSNVSAVSELMGVQRTHRKCADPTLYTALGNIFLWKKIAGQFFFFKVEAYNTEHHFDQESGVQQFTDIILVKDRKQLLELKHYSHIEL